MIWNLGGTHAGTARRLAPVERGQARIIDNRDSLPHSMVNRRGEEHITEVV
jgi:hypothetical protein